jgi:hypothetical protein
MGHSLKVISLRRSLSSSNRQLGNVPCRLAEFLLSNLGAHEAPARGQLIMQVYQDSVGLYSRFLSDRLVRMSQG